MFLDVVRLKFFGIFEKYVEKFFGIFWKILLWNFLEFLNFPKNILKKMLTFYPKYGTILNVRKNFMEKFPEKEKRKIKKVLTIPKIRGIIKIQKGKKGNRKNEKLYIC